MAATIREQVKEFMTAIGQGVLPSPRVPRDEIVRLRCRLVLEEALEFLEACGVDQDFRTHQAKSLLEESIKTMSPNVDLVKAADALADLDYVVEGARLAFGINGEPIAAEVHRTNMAKLGGPKDEHGKCLKPEGWKPPDIESLIHAQMRKEEDDG